MEEEKKFPTPAMLKAREAWAKMPEAEKQEIMNGFREELRRYYAGGFSRETRRALLGEETDE